MGLDVLIVHQNFPGQYRHLAQALLRRGDRVRALGAAVLTSPSIALGWLVLIARRLHEPVAQSKPPGP